MRWSGQHAAASGLPRVAVAWSGLVQAATRVLAAVCRQTCRFGRLYAMRGLKRVSWRTPFLCMVSSARRVSRDKHCTCRVQAPGDKSSCLSQRTGSAWAACTVQHLSCNTQACRLLCRLRQHLGQGLQPIIAQQQLAQTLQAEQLRDVAADLVPGRPLEGHLLQ